MGEFFLPGIVSQPDGHLRFCRGSDQENYNTGKTLSACSNADTRSLANFTTFNHKLPHVCFPRIPAGLLQEAEIGRSRPVLKSNNTNHSPLPILGGGGSSGSGKRNYTRSKSSSAFFPFSQSACWPSSEEQRRLASGDRSHQTYRALRDRLGHLCCEAPVPAAMHICFASAHHR